MMGTRATPPPMPLDAAILTETTVENQGAMDINLILDFIGSCPSAGVDKWDLFSGRSAGTTAVTADDDCAEDQSDGDDEARDVEMRQNLALYIVADRHAARAHHDGITSIVECLGNDSRKYH